MLLIIFPEYGVWKIISPILRRQTKHSAQNVPWCLKTPIWGLPWHGSFSTGEYSFSTKNSGLWVFCFLSITHRENHSFVNSCLSICCDMLRYLALSLHYLAESCTNLALSLHYLALSLHYLALSLHYLALSLHYLALSLHYPCTILHYS